MLWTDKNREEGKGRELTIKSSRERVMILDDPLIDEDPLGARAFIDFNRVVCRVHAICFPPN